MRALRLPLRLYVAAVIVVGAAALIVAAWSVRPDRAEIATAVVLLALATVAQLRPVHLSPKIKVTAEDAATFAAALLLDPLLAMSVAGGSKALAGLRGRASWYNRAFNVAALVLDNGAAAVAYRLLAGDGDGVALGPALGAAAVKFGINTTVVDLAVALQLRRRPFANWTDRHRRDVVQLAALYLVGALGATAAAASPATLALFIAPSALVLLTLRNAARLEARTRRAIDAIARRIEQRDTYTYGHSQRVAAYAERLALRMRLEPSQVDLVREAALLHDVGKVGIPDRVLLKPCELDAGEREVMHRHADVGYSMLAELPEFWEGAELVRAHHERVDGAGYPRGLRGHEVPIEVSVIAVADTYDAMTTDRVYRKALPWPAVRAELERERGRQWHAEVVDAFLGMLDDERRAAA